MKLSTADHQINGGRALLAATPVRQLLDTALTPIVAPPSVTQFTAQLAPLLRNAAQGWLPGELEFTTHQPPGGGRRRAIDHFHDSGVGVEISLANYTAFSHDLLKLETALRNNHIDLGVVLTLADGERAKLRWPDNTSYLSLSKAATWLQVFGPSLGVPLVLLGFES